MKLTLSLIALCLCVAGASIAEDAFLAGTDSGLYQITKSGSELLWNKNDVRKIVRAGDTWYFLTGGGIFSSESLSLFEERNAGLPVKVLKVPTNGSKNFLREVQELKDLEVNPDDPKTLVTATKDAVYVTRDGGTSWKNVGIAATTAGIKAVAILNLPDSSGRNALTVLMSHPIYGVSYRNLDDPKSAWADLDVGLEQVPSIKWPDEVADLQAVRRGGKLVLFASQTFMPRIYRLDWTAKRFVRVWSGSAYADTVEGLAPTDSSVVFTAPEGIREVPVDMLASAAVTAPGAAKNVYKISFPAPSEATATTVTDWKQSLDSVPGRLLSAWVPPARTVGRGGLSLSELWLLSPGEPVTPYAKNAILKKGNYIPVHQVTTAEGYERHLKTLKDNKLNMLVVDMKDDYGTLRYDSKDPLVLAKGKAGKGIKVEPFVAEAKANGIYLVARIVVFKDRSLAAWGGGRYAVWNAKEQRPWQGYEWITRKVAAAAATGTATPGANGAAGSATAAEASPAAESPAPAAGALGGGMPQIAGQSGAAQKAAGTAAPATETVKKVYDEFWVDPYCEEVWEYDVAIAKELIARGFDEIQFDYIRFPTDGDNLADASYRWQDPGMDKESALMSFLSYARREIKAPISIDIYGANGWYRTGARTGQDVELLARYVDVICPMFYPSHFEQTFLAQAPSSERPYRIYYYGTYRNAVIARNHVIVRPWAQAFYLNVSYDRAWYNADYVQRQIFGTRDSINEGYTYWNNSGRYGDLRPDIDRATPYPWSAPEAVFSRNNPMFGTK
jgi:hypothetical protein